MNSSRVKLVVFAPISSADAVRTVLGEAGAGKIGNYDFCSFSTRGLGRFRGNSDATPTMGIAENFESVEEERIEVIVERALLKEVIEKMKKVHPYEEVSYEITALEDL